MKLITIITALAARVAADTTTAVSEYHAYNQDQSTANYKPQLSEADFKKFYAIPLRPNSPSACFGTEFEVWEQL